MTAALAAIAAACSLWAWTGPGPSARLPRRHAPRRRDGPWRPPVRAVLPAALLGVVGLGVLRVNLVVAVVAGVVLGAIVRLRDDARARAERSRTQALVTALCEGLGAEVAAGTPPELALERVAREDPRTTTLGRAARLGGDVPRALRELSRAPGAAGLADLAAAWEVSARTGAGLGGVVDRVADVQRRDDDLAHEVDASVSSARATARLLAVLPVLALALGSALGGNPWAFLVSSGAGPWCLAAGSGLALAGVFWVERLTDRARPR